MKKIIVLTFMILGLIGCCSNNGDEKVSRYHPMKEYFNYEVISISSYGDIVVDKDTGVLYYFSPGRVTPLYNADGTLKNIKNFR